MVIRKSFLFLILTSLVFGKVYCQVGINTNLPDSAVALDINAQTSISFGGMQIPLVTPAQQASINTTASSDGTLVYVNYTTQQCLEIYDGVTNSWQQIHCSTVTSQLIISEYIEGGGNNKFIELYNGTSSTIDLSTIKLIIFRNGGDFPIGGTDREIFITGSIAPGDTFVIANVLQTEVSASVIDYNVPNAGDPLDFNGDDPVLLTDLSNNIIDVVGIPGTDPGTGYAVDGQDTYLNGIRRIASITDPNASWNTSEWTAHPENDFSHLGTR